MEESPRTDYGFYSNGAITVQIRNFTPHPVTVVRRDGTVLEEFPPDPEGPARSHERSIRMTPLVAVVISEGMERLPDPEPGVALIVSMIVKNQLPLRRDLLSPADIVRNAEGTPIGCRVLLL